MAQTIRIDEVDNMLDVCVYGEQEKVTDTLSKCRLRIFYRGMNRNRTFISEEFATQLINSLPYAPIKGIFSYADVDFEDHGEENSDGRIYGIVPENPNFRWEDHTDKDGVIRNYACCDVYLFTALYPEAKIVSGKSQSMEIYSKTVEGEWRVWEDGLPYYHFTKGSLVGLQILGDTTEPCFEGSAFFSLCDDLKQCLSYMKEIIKKEEVKGMNNDVTSVEITETTEPVLENQVEETEKVAETVETVAEPVVEEPTVDNALEETTETEVAEAKETTETVEEPVAEVAEEPVAEAVEEPAVDNTLEEASVVEEAPSVDYEARIKELENTLSEKETEIANLKSELETIGAEKIVLENAKNDLQTENTKLAEFKANCEAKEKEEIISEFSARLPQTKLDELRAKMNEFSIEDFKKELCAEAYEANTLFSNESNLIYKNSSEKEYESEAIKLLNKYTGGNR